MIINNKMAVQNSIPLSENEYLISITNDSDGNKWACGFIRDKSYDKPFFITIDNTTKKAIMKKYVLSTKQGHLQFIIENINKDIWMCGFINDGSYDKPFFAILDKSTKNIVIQKCISSVKHGRLYSIMKDSNSNIWMCGYVNDGSYDKPFFIVLDKDTKEVIMQKVIPFSNNGYLYSIINDSKGNIWGCGYVNDGSFDNPFYMIMDKTAKKVNIRKCIIPSKHGYLYHITKSFDGNIWLIGYTYDGSHKNPLLLVIDKDTNKIIMKKCILSNEENPFSVTIDVDKKICTFNYANKDSTINIDLTNIPDSNSCITDIDFEIEETNYTVKSTFYIVENTSYPLKSVSYNVKAMEE